jgi:hypothetical protein
MENVILNVATNEYVPLQKRLIDTLKIHETKDDFLCWTDQLPDGSPAHKEVPYAFKVHAFLEARKKGYKKALWLDSPIYCKKNIEPVWNYINDTGYLFVHSYWKIGQWCTQEALVKHGITRDEGMNIFDNWACIIGLNFENKDANDFLDSWYEASKDGVSFIGPWTVENPSLHDPRYMGHRHDQVISAILCHKMGLKRMSWDKPELFAYHFQGNQDVCLVSTR